LFEEPNSVKGVFAFFRAHGTQKGEDASRVEPFICTLSGFPSLCERHRD
jgi:hypothetical protein